MSESDMEKPVPDSVDQGREISEEEDGQLEEPADLPLDANEADAAEQRREVGLDEDDYR